MTELHRESVTHFKPSKHPSADFCNFHRGHVRTLEDVSNHPLDFQGNGT